MEEACAKENQEKVFKGNLLPRNESLKTQIRQMKIGT